MNTSCALCGLPLTPMDTVLGENKLSDGGILCNKCLNKATAVNKDLVHSLINYNVAEIRELVWGESIEEVEDIEEENVTETSMSHTSITFSHTSVRFSIGKTKPTRSDEIQEQIFALNVKLSSSVNDEVGELAKVLDKDEKLVAIADARYLHNNANGLLVATQRRVVFLNRKFFGSVYKKEFLHQNIHTVSDGKGENPSLLKMITNESTTDFILNSSHATHIFCEAIESYINSSGNKQKQQAANPEFQSPKPVQKEDPSTVFDKLEKLGRLRDNGILTDDEFAEQKKKLLDKL
ncbi:SHOCT domain-containing protein [Chryseobacterium tructae]|uniref:SHOCT domain-containing protein n=1 Tax=Chryseobacterium tructae TaxID=1037380 RepID=A0ABV7XVY0_9FLAO|nr:SHOCT domain-containing protein [Chryseobacterium tructae]MDN3692881.1 SHOCT domain-containing protein [Chryseobacterium tructae]